MYGVNYWINRMKLLNNSLKPNFSKNIYIYDENEVILSDIDNFKE